MTIDVVGRSALLKSNNSDYPPALQYLDASDIGRFDSLPTVLRSVDWLMRRGRTPSLIHALLVEPDSNDYDEVYSVSEFAS